MANILKFRKRAAALVLTAVIMCAPMTAFAADDNDSGSDVPAVWADADPNLPSADMNSPDAIRWFAQIDKGKEMTHIGKTAATRYFLLLPASADLNALTLWHSFESDPTIDGMAIKSGEVTSAIHGEGEYIMKAGDKEYTLTVMQDHALGSIYINTETGDMNSIHGNKSVKESGQIIVVDDNGEVNYDGELSYIKGRGNTTWRLIKKPYNIKLDKKAELLGMDASKKWCLLANAQDHTMLRNKIAFDLSDELGMDFSPDSHHVNLYLNGDYAGVYQLSEKVEAGKNNLVKINDIEDATEKVNDADLDSYSYVDTGTEKGSKKYFEIPNDPEDITGGYLMEFDTANKYADELSGFVTNRNQCVVVKNPEAASKAQVEYISGFMQEMEDAIYSDTGYNDKGKHYSEYLDMESAALMYLIQEYSLNVDSGVTSCFFYKDSDSKGDGKVHAAPVWDFDVAFGNLDYKNSPTEIYARTRAPGNNGGRNFFVELCTHTDFNREVNRLYKEKFKPALTILNSSEKTSGTILKSIEQYRSDLTKAAEMNFTRWNIKANVLVPGSGRSFDKQVDYLKDFTSQRAEFFDTSLFKEKTPGDTLNIYCYRTWTWEDWDDIYAYCYDDVNKMEWPGVKMEKAEFDNDIYKLDLTKYGFKDDGTVKVIFNNGAEKKTKSVIAEDNLLYEEIAYYYEDDKGEFQEYTDSYIDKFNEKNIVKLEFMRGDVDDDMTITSSDALKILRYSVGLAYFETSQQMMCACVDDNDVIDSADALYVLRYSVGFTKNAPVHGDYRLGEKQIITYYSIWNDD